MAERGECGGRVVGAVLQAEPGSGPDATPVAPVIDRDDAVAAGELRQDREEVQVGGGRPAVEQEQDRGVGRPVELADERRAPIGQLEVSSWRERGADEVDGGLARQFSISWIVTESVVPVGVA